MPTALFTINGDTSNQGYDAAADDVLTLRLKQLPPAGVATVLFQVFRAGGFSADLGIAANPPRSSPGAPQLTLEGATSGQSVSPVAVDGTVTVTLPSELGNSWIVRCVVNGGMGTLPDGRTGPVPGLVHERMIAVRDANGCRAVIPTETTQYNDDGWAGALNEMRALLGGGGGSVPDPLTVGTILAPGGDPGDERAQINLGMTQINVVAAADDTAGITLATFGAGYYLTAHEHVWSLNEGVAMVRARAAGGTMLLGFYGVEPTTRPEVTNVEGTENLLNEVIEGLVLLGLFTDAR